MIRYMSGKINQVTDYTVIDLEMTGLNVKKDKIIEIGAAKVRGGKVVETYSTFLNVNREIPERVTEITGITQEMIAQGLPENEGMEKLLSFMGEDLLLGQNFSFDYSFIRQWAVNNKVAVNNSYLDTLQIARKLLPPEQSKALEALCQYFGIKRSHGHRALEDALQTHEVYIALRQLALEKGIETQEEWDKTFLVKAMNFKVKKISPITKSQVEQIKKYRETHGVTEPISWETLNRSEATRLMEHYYKTYGR